MRGGFLIRHSRLTALGIVLSVLAALFAMEAKIAWFSPAGSATAQISYDKACPAEPLKALHQRSNTSSPQAGDFARIATLLAAVLVLAPAAAVVLLLLPSASRPSASPGFSAALFFRPPPVS
jgi:hypothetical protein